MNHEENNRYQAGVALDTKSNMAYKIWGRQL